MKNGKFGRVENIESGEISFIPFRQAKYESHKLRRHILFDIWRREQYQKLPETMISTYGFTKISNKVCLIVYTFYSVVRQNVCNKTRTINNNKK